MIIGACSLHDANLAVLGYVSIAAPLHNKSNKLTTVNLSFLTDYIWVKRENSFLILNHEGRWERCFNIMMMMMVCVVLPEACEPVRCLSLSSLCSFCLCCRSFSTCLALVTHAWYANCRITHHIYTPHTHAHRTKSTQH